MHQRDQHRCPSGQSRSEAFADAISRGWSSIASSLNFCVFDSGPSNDATPRIEAFCMPNGQVVCVETPPQADNDKKKVS